MKKVISFFIFGCLLLSFSLTVFATGNEKFSWYIIRNQSHLQPTAEKKMQFIEKYNGIFVDKAHGDTVSEKVVYLTFDAGYENGNVELILNTLKEENVRAAFFILDTVILKHPNLVLRMIDEGHTVCNHTARHANITKFSSKDALKKELCELEDAYFKLTGREMKKYFRPPEGSFDEISMQRLNELGYKTIFWSFAYADWDNDNQPSEKYAKEKILQNLHNGAILLLHPTSKTNALILKDVINEIRSQGYRFASLDEL